MTAHQRDPFVIDRLPPKEAWPELIFTLPELQYPQELNCAERFLDRHLAQGRGAERCILAPGTAWTYDDLFERANRIARVLVEDLDIEPGNRVLLRGANTPMLAACWFAVMKAGAVAVTTMPLYRASELRAILEKAQVSAALCDARLREDLDAAAPAAPGLRTLYFGGGNLEEHMAKKPAAFENVRTAADDPAIIGFTSGTTGAPKAAVHFHRDLLAICDTYGKHVLRAQPSDLFAGSPPLGFTFGLGGLLLFPLDAGAATLLLESAPPQILLPAIEEHGVTTIFTAPIAYRAMAERIGDHDVRSLRTCASAGETLPQPIWQTWYERTGIKILDGIGSTEMLHIFIGSPADRAKGGATGEVVPGYAAEVHDDDGKALPPGAVGRLAVKGPTGCRYLDDDRQQRYVQNGWNYPGDAYRMDEDGYFYYVARADDMIISAGYNVSGPEVEAVLLAHPQVAECGVVAKPDPAHGTNIVKAYVVLSACEGSEQKREELIEFVRGKIAAFKAPREIEFVAQLPRTQTGKVQRFKLRERAASE